MPPAIRALLAEGDDSLAATSASARAPSGAVRPSQGAACVWRRHKPAGTEQFSLPCATARWSSPPPRAYAVRRPRHGDATYGRRPAGHHSSGGEIAAGRPLADPVLDLRVHSATRILFRQSRDYLQIIDVDGRQCTDFQCFSARKLDKGRPSARRDDDPHADGIKLSVYARLHSNTTTRTWSRWSRWCRTRVADMTPSRSLARPNITTTSSIPSTPTARRSSRALSDKGVNPARLDGDQLLLQHGNRRAWRHGV